MKYVMLTNVEKKIFYVSKKIILVIVIILSFNVSFAQENSIKSEQELIQETFGFVKKDIISTLVNLDDVDADKFWKLYDEYEVLRKELGKERMNLLYQYTTHKGAVSNMQAERLMKKVIPLRAANDNLVQKFYNKIKNATNPIVASQFYQIEHYISDGIRFGILDNINFIQDKIK